MDETFQSAITSMMGSPAMDICQLTGGANNKTFKAKISNEPYCIKIYYHDSSDKRDRLGAEFRMLDFLWKNGVRCIPKPVAVDINNHIGIYEYIDGEKLKPNIIQWKDIAELKKLLIDMWELKDKNEAVTLPTASDAAFSIRSHIDSVHNRLSYIESSLVLVSPGIKKEISNYFSNYLLPMFDKIISFVEKNTRKSGISLEYELTKEEKTLSPSDHGFHNAIRKYDGKIIFIDFEYSGWDDPAQMIGNACHQPEIPIPDDLRERFITEILESYGNCRKLDYRIRILYPLFGFKWCLIMLNEYLPVSIKRREFSGINTAIDQSEQLSKSRKKLDSLKYFMNEVA